MSGLKRIKDLFGPMAALGRIKPPERSLVDWERFLREATECALHAPGRDQVGPLGIALIERAKWLKNAQVNGYNWLRAERAWEEAHPSGPPGGLGAPEESYESLVAHSRDLGL